MANENPYAKYKAQSQPVPVAQIKPIIAAPTDPYAADREARARSAEARAQTDQALQMEAAARARAQAEREAARFEKEMTGIGRKPLREGDAQKLTDDVASVDALERALNSFQDDFVGLTADIENVAQGVTGMGTPGQRDWWADFRATDNQIRNQLFGASLTAGEKSAYASTTITPRMAPEEVRRNLQRRLEIARKAAARRFDRLNAAGYNPDEVAAIVGEVDLKTPVEQRNPLAGGQSAPVQITSGERFSTEQEIAYANALNAALAQGAGVQELALISQRFDVPIGPDDIAKFQGAVERRAAGAQIQFLPTQSGVRNPLSQALGEAAMTPAGTALVGATNAATLGGMSLLAGDKVQGLEALNPKSAIAGELVGSMAGTAGLAKGAAAGLKAVAPGLSERLLGGGIKGAVAREALTEGTYGGAYAANTGQDIGTGITLGAIGSLGGQALGAAGRRVLGRVGDVPPGGGDIPPGGAPDTRPMPEGPAGGGAMPGAGTADEPFVPYTVRSNDAGSAGTSPETLRRTQAEGLPVPIELTRGAATRDAEQLAFEKEQLYGALGGPLRKRAEENNVQALENFDRLIDMTGAQAPDIAATGNAVIGALAKGYQAAKNKVNVAYKRADMAGETQELVDYRPILDYIAQQPTTTVDQIAPILKTVAEQLRKNDPDGVGQITIRDLEEVRKLINKNVQYGTPNANYGGQLKGLIDEVTDGAGGKMYQEARKLRIEQARKFENRAIVARLVSNVKNMDDPRVAADKVFQKSILNAAPEEIQFLRRTLRTSGADGRQAWKELQGATIRHIQEVATSGVNLTSDNLPVISTAKLNQELNKLDKNGRLDVIFDPKTAQTMRDLRDVVQYVNTVPPGTSINTSGTARTLIAALAEMGTLGAATGLPLPVISGLKLLRDSVRDAKIKAKIAKSLLPQEPR